MPKRNSDLILDNLRMDLHNTEPGFEGLRWEIAKGEIKMMLGELGPNKKSVAVMCLLVGAGIGIFGVKYVPKSKPVKFVNFIKEAVKAEMRLRKIMMEEYQRLDEAIEAEQMFLDMMSQDLSIRAVLIFEDDGRDRHMKLSFKLKKDGKENNG